MGRHSNSRRTYRVHHNGYPDSNRVALEDVHRTQVSGRLSLLVSRGVSSTGIPSKIETSVLIRSHSVAAAAIVHAVYVANYERSQHPSIALVPAFVAAEAELCWSLTSATIPTLKNFMKSFATGFGHEFGLGMAAWPDRAQVPAGTKGKKITASIPLVGISRKFWHAERPGDFVSDPQSSGYETEVSGAHGLDMQPRTSGGSQEMIIRKDITMSVDHGSELREST